MKRELGSGGTEYSTDWAAIRQSWKCRAQNKRQAEGERRNLALDRARAVARHLKAFLPGPITGEQWQKRRKSLELFL
ncbi:hypothetical protein V3F56_13810 [Moorellaceae bacterium AZ2]